MVYISDFLEFQAKALDLLSRDPIQTRYVTKYRQKDNEAVIKVTNDKECWQFKIDQSNMEHANDYISQITQSFIKLSCNRRVDDAAAVEGGAGAGGKKKGKKGGKH
ncbi:hypothetical protein FGO68_gene7349 [Halteria grandinella]|uniref:SRP9 domain-containing protein n=1 Tax=Halteria grandinella TaxID=5974 RepID=A0A8J8NC09_HALGN|nr:hypothetical protein FGO68_gene7349 [Halteria grandinella]